MVILYAEGLKNSINNVNFCKECLIHMYFAIFDVLKRAGYCYVGFKHKLLVH